MKKLLFSILTFLFLANPAMAANTATAYPAVPVSVAGSPINNMIPVLVVIDTTGQDLVYFTPDSDKSACVAASTFSQAAAFNLVLKSASGPTVTLSNTTFQGSLGGMGNGFIYCAISV